MNQSFFYKKKTKPANWLSVEGAVPVRGPLKVPKKRGINPFTQSKRRKKASQVYKFRKEIFITLYPRCAGFLARHWVFHLMRMPPAPHTASVIQTLIELAPLANTIHHMRGHAGQLYEDPRFWLAVNLAEHRWIHENMNRARLRGSLCQLGKWGEQPEDYWEPIDPIYAKT